MGCVLNMMRISEFILDSNKIKIKYKTFRLSASHRQVVRDVFTNFQNECSS
jgi:hypothetical protein